jgi:hypothetical protein
VHALFAVDAVRVCVDVAPTRSGDFATLRSFDGNDILLGEVNSAPGVPQTLCIDGRGVRAVRFGGFEDRYARFDDLIVYSSPELPEAMPVVVRFVPEPAPGLLAGAALAALFCLACLARRSRPRRPLPPGGQRTATM